MSTLWTLAEHGQSPWMDNLSREMLETGTLARRVSDEGLRGITANPTTFERALSSSHLYNAQIGDGAREGLSSPTIYEALATADVRAACDTLRDVFEGTNGQDGFVSLEISPHLAHDAAASVVEARRLHVAVDRPNVLIKVPGTKEGIEAIETLLIEGINVNVTLLFSVERYEAIAEAYVRALEHRLVAGYAIDRVASVASFFLSRIDVLVDRLLSQRVKPDGTSPFDPHPGSLRGRAALASAKLAHRRLRARMASHRWKELEARGARPQRLLWASTSTKDPAYPDLMYVEPLVGPDTVTTMPEQTIAAFIDHGTATSTLAKGTTAAAAVLRDLRRLGIDPRQVATQLENEGIDKFVRSYDAAITAIETRRVRQAAAPELAPLTDVARQLRRDVIQMTTEAGSGHPTSCMSAAEIIAGLFFRVMRWDPGAPRARDVDTFVLSKGHAAPILWAALSRAGAITEDLMTLRRIDSPLEGHPTPRSPWVRVATGSLGQGLSVANGLALANRLDGIDARVFCLLGDGECSEGSVWEAAQFAALSGLGNVTAIVDQNGLGQSAPAPYGNDTGVFSRRFRAFGWTAIEIDGHDMGEVTEALERAASAPGPTAIVARTVKGKGVSFLEGRADWHGKALDRQDARRALDELGGDEASPPVQARRLGQSPPSASSAEAPPLTLEYRPGAEAATRDGFGAALQQVGARPEVVVIDGDVRGSTRTTAFAESWPDQFIEGYIAEQNMVGTAMGLASCGKVPVVVTFACFLTRAADFVRMAGHSRSPQIVFCGSHAGVSIGQDGPSQMGLEDIAMFRALSESTVLYPCDAVSAARLTEQAASTRGIVYLRTSRPKTPVIYAPDEVFPVGGSKTLRRSPDDHATIVAAGITVHEALAAFETLKARGIAARVVDAYSVKPIDIETLRQAADETRRLVIVEDHWAEGGLGDAVTAALAGVPARITHLAVRGEPHSGSARELLDLAGISRSAIVSAVERIDATAGAGAS